MPIPKSYFSKMATLWCHQTWRKPQAGKSNGDFPTSHLWHRLGVNVEPPVPMIGIYISRLGDRQCLGVIVTKNNVISHIQQFHSQFHRSDTSVLSRVGCLGCELLKKNSVFWSDGWHGVLKWSCYLLDASIFTLAWDSWDDDLLYIDSCLSGGALTTNHWPNELLVVSSIAQYHLIEKFGTWFWIQPGYPLVN